MVYVPDPLEEVAREEFRRYAHLILAEGAIRKQDRRRWTIRLREKEGGDILRMTVAEAATVSSADEFVFITDGGIRQRRIAHALKPIALIAGGLLALVVFDAALGGAIFDVLGLREAP